MTQEAMLVFSLGPVQSFILQARKTRDLWLGSYLLSKLMEAAMENIKGEFVFPSKREIEGNIPDLPNKYIAIFATSDDASTAAKQSRRQIRKRWNTIKQEVWSKIIADSALKPEEIEAAEKIWNRQTNPDTFFEIFWVIVEKDPKEDYKAWLKRTQAALDARKRLRDFAQLDELELGEKSMISGEREVLRGKETSREQVRDFWRRLTQSLSPKDIHQDGTERLDAIDMVKRFATKSSFIPQQPFPSTSSVATASFVNRLLSAKEKVDASALTGWHNTTRDAAGSKLVLSEDYADTIPYLKPKAGEQVWLLRRDGDCYFPETFTPRYLIEEYRFPDNDDTKRQAKNCEIALEKLLEATDKLSIPRPTPYYAVVQMDGDHMGDLLSGVQDKSEHEKISAALSSFARQDAVTLIQKKHPGRLVYAGGDDVLAFTPLESSLELVNKLQKTYCSIVKDAVIDAGRKGKVTASIGIAIAHHYTPLSFVLRAARDAEDLAKKRYGRNAVVLTVIRRSGEQTRVGCRWQYPGLEKNAAPIEPIPLFSRFRELFEKDVLSPKCIHILLDEAPTLVWLDREAQASEIKRVLKRQRSEALKNEFPDSEIVERAKQLSELATVMNTEHTHKQKSTELSEDKPRYGLIETLGWLLAMAFLAGRSRTDEAVS